jgi:hypothetical protein
MGTPHVLRIGNLRRVGDHALIRPTFATTHLCLLAHRLWSATRIVGVRSKPPCAVTPAFSGKIRKGTFIIRRISALKKLKAKLKELKDKLKRMVHLDLAEVGSWLSSVYKGWCNYHAVPLNSTRLNQFRSAIQKIWLTILRRRSQRAHRMTWANFGKLCRRRTAEGTGEIRPKPTARRINTTGLENIFCFSSA